MDIGNSEAFSKAPQCTWTAIPPPELRGSLIEDLSTNGGFVSFGIFPLYTESNHYTSSAFNNCNVFLWHTNKRMRFRDQLDKSIYVNVRKWFLLQSKHYTPYEPWTRTVVGLLRKFCNYDENFRKEICCNQ